MRVTKAWKAFLEIVQPGGAKMTPEEIAEVARMALVLAEHVRECADCAACPEDDVCPVGQEIVEQLFNQGRA